MDDCWLCTICGWYGECDPDGLGRECVGCGGNDEDQAGDCSACGEDTAFVCPNCGKNEWTDNTTSGFGPVECYDPAILEKRKKKPNSFEEK